GLQVLSDFFVGYCGSCYNAGVCHAMEGRKLIELLPKWTLPHESVFLWQQSRCASGGGVGFFRFALRAGGSEAAGALCPPDKPRLARKSVVLGDVPDGRGLLQHAWLSAVDCLRGGRDACSAGDDRPCAAYIVWRSAGLQARRRPIAAWPRFDRHAGTLGSRLE